MLLISDTNQYNNVYIIKHIINYIIYIINYMIMNSIFIQYNNSNNRLYKKLE